MPRDHRIYRQAMGQMMSHGERKCVACAVGLGKDWSLAETCQRNYGQIKMIFSFFFFFLEIGNIVVAPKALCDALCFFFILNWLESFMYSFKRNCVSVVLCCVEYRRRSAIDLLETRLYYLRSFIHIVLNSSLYWWISWSYMHFFRI